MTFLQAEQYLYSLMNFPRQEYMLDPRGCGVYLDRLNFFLKILGHPEQRIPHYIHVTGTSGKGSVVNFLHSILREAGKSKQTPFVASYISPHPHTINERFRVDNRVMSKKEFAELVKKIQPAMETYVKTSPYDMLSFFELNVAMALLYFAEQGVTWAIFEVGCGGRYDGTNILPYKDAAIITNIELDHTHILGNTKEKIAHEKAGIIKKGAHVFTFEKNKKILSLLAREAKQEGAASFTRVDVRDWPKNLGVIRLNCIGKHQKKNAVLAGMVAERLGFTAQDIVRGLAKTVQTLRMQIVSDKPLIIFDSAHNPDKMKTTVLALKKIIESRQNKTQHKKNILPHPLTGKTISARKHNAGSLCIVLAFSANKEWEKMVDKLLELGPSSIYCTKQTQNIFRKVVSPKDIAEYIKRKNKRIYTDIFLEPQKAYTAAKKKIKKSDILLVTGSLFMSGEIHAGVDKKGNLV